MFRIVTMDDFFFTLTLCTGSITLSEKTYFHDWEGIKYAKSVLIKKIREISELFLNKGYAKYFCLHNIMDNFTSHQLITVFFILDGKVKKYCRQFSC